MQHKLCPLAAVIATFLLTGAAAAETPSGEPSTRLEPVRVSITRAERLLLDVPASVDVIDGATLRDAQLRVNLSETLGRVAGLTVLDRGNYAQDLQISVRGFGSRASFGVRGIRLYVDGVPAASPDGQGQVSNFPLGAAERIEVLRGPFSALYGSSSGGVIVLTSELRSQPLRITPNAAVGSFGTWRAGLNAVGGEGGFAWAFDGSRFSTDGARGHSAARRDLINLRLGFADSPVGRLRVSVNALDMPDTQDPLGLTRAQMQTDPTQASPVALQFNTRKTTRQATLGASTEAALGQATLTASAWVGTRAVTQFQAIPVTTQSAPRHPGGVIDFDRQFGGADLRVGWDIGALSLTAGLAAERLDEDRQGYENFVGSTLGVTGRLRRDETNTLTAVDPYLQAEWRTGAQWRWLAGLRYSTLRFESRDRYIVGSNGDDSGTQSYSGLTPTLGVVFRAQPAMSWYASYGRGFETPTLSELAYRPDGSAGFNNGLRAARSDNLEAGVKYAPGSALRATLAVFAIRTEDDLVVRTNSGGRSAFGNVGQTRRDGVEMSADWRINAAWSLYASAAVLRARFSEPFLACGPAPCTTPSVPVAAGARLPGVPARTVFVEVKHRAGWADLGAEWRAQSSLAVDDVNSDFAAGYAVVNLSAARSVGVGSRSLRAYVRLNNAFDRRYVGSVIVNEGNRRFFEPAAGRAVLAGFDLAL
jgi:iron complex outermembrane receptor protein